MTKKPKESKYFEPVDWHHDHLEGGTSYSYGLGFITCMIQIGNCSFTVNHRLYMGEKTVRRLKRSRLKEKRLKFRSKYSLARAMLLDLLLLIPKGRKVYVLFDSWYSSVKLIKFCLRHKWHVICALKHNRLLDGKGLSSHAKYLKNKSFIPVRLNSAESVTECLTYSLRGHLNDIPNEVCVIISKRHSRDRRPEYFLSTDLSLSAERILNWYTKRWSCEVDYLYLKGRLGLEDFRLRSVEGITKYFALIFLALAYLQFRLVKERGPKIKALADVISLHRGEHFENLLKEFCQLTLQKGSPEPILQRFFVKVT